MFGEEGCVVAYIRTINDMYKGVKTSVTTSRGETEDFPIDIRLHQGPALSPFLLTKGIQNAEPCVCYLLIILFLSMRLGINLMAS